jgi:hypothetical protein
MAKGKSRKERPRDAAPISSARDPRARREEQIKRAERERFGPLSILGLSHLTAADLKRIEAAKTKAAKSSPGLSKREFRTIVEKVVAEHTALVLQKIDPRGMSKLQAALFGFALGVAQNGAYDLLKPYLIAMQAMFMADQQEAEMAAAGARAQAAIAELDPEVQAFVLNNNRLMANLRASTWSPIREIVAECGLGDRLGEGSLVVLAHTLERELFLLRE